MLAFRNALNSRAKVPNADVSRNISQQIRTLVRNCNRLLVPDGSWRVMMHSDELPTSLVQKVAKVGDRAFLSVVKSHHLSRKGRQLSSCRGF
jgi:hypothetical protein